jgi:hypothetical protein
MAACPFLALSPAEVEQPVLGKLIRVSQLVDCQLADVAYRLVELLDLFITEIVAVLLRMNFGVVENLVSNPIA